MPILIFSKHSIRYVSACLESFVSCTHELCSLGWQAGFSVECKRCGSEEERFGYTAPSSKLVTAWFCSFEDVAQHLLCPIMKSKE